MQTPNPELMERYGTDVYYLRKTGSLSAFLAAQLVGSATGAWREDTSKLEEHYAKAEELNQAARYWEAVKSEEIQNGFRSGAEKMASMRALSQRVGKRMARQEMQRQPVQDMQKEANPLFRSLFMQGAKRVKKAKPPAASIGAAAKNKKTVLQMPSFRDPAVNVARAKSNPMNNPTVQQALKANPATQAAPAVKPITKPSAGVTPSQAAPTPRTPTGRPQAQAFEPIPDMRGGPAQPTRVTNQASGLEQAQTPYRAAGQAPASGPQPPPRVAGPITANASQRSPWATQATGRVTTADLAGPAPSAAPALVQPPMVRNVAGVPMAGDQAEAALAALPSGTLRPYAGKAPVMPTGPTTFPTAPAANVAEEVAQGAAQGKRPWGDLALLGGLGLAGGATYLGGKAIGAARDVLGAPKKDYHYGAYGPQMQASPNSAGYVQPYQ